MTLTVLIFYSKIDAMKYFAPLLFVLVSGLLVLSNNVSADDVTIFGPNGYRSRILVFGRYIDTFNAKSGTATLVVVDGEEQGGTIENSVWANCHLLLASGKRNCLHARPRSRHSCLRRHSRGHLPSQPPTP